MEITRAVYTDGHITVHMLVEGERSCARYQVDASDPASAWESICVSMMASVTEDSGAYRPIVPLEMG